MIGLTQLIAGIKAFHKQSENRNRGVQALMSSSSFAQILILSIMWTRN